MWGIKNAELYADVKSVLWVQKIFQKKLQEKTAISEKQKSCLSLLYRKFFKPNSTHLESALNSVFFVPYIDFLGKIIFGSYKPFLRYTQKSEHFQTFCFQSPQMYCTWVHGGKTLYARHRKLTNFPNIPQWCYPNKTVYLRQYQRT